MPVHWYYDQAALERDYGHVVDYLAPKNPHPDSILWRSSYTALNAQGDILHDQAQYWGRKNIHYHQFLSAGVNTLNLKLLRLAFQSMQESGGDNVHRGAVLGALAGLEKGLYAFPDRWLQGLEKPVPAGGVLAQGGNGQ